MLTNAFAGFANPPSAKELADALGPTSNLWNKLVADLERDCADRTEWGSSSKKLGWSLRVKRADRIIVYLSPGDGCFLASFALGDRAMQAARATTKFPAAVMKILKDAKRYAEGNAVRLEVHAGADAAHVLALAKIKLAN